MLLQTLERMFLNKLLTPRPGQKSLIYSQRTRTCFLRKSLFVSLVVEHLFSPSQESLMCQHLLQRNCSLNQTNNFFASVFAEELSFCLQPLLLASPKDIRNEEDTCVKISYNIWLTIVSVSPLGDDLYLSLTNSFKKDYI